MAFLQPPASQQPAFNIPSSVVVLLALLIVGHAARALASPEISSEIAVRYAFNPALYSTAWMEAHGRGMAPLWQQALSFVSYIFLHADLTHLAINCLWLLAFGPVVARRFGAARFWAFFFVCGFAAALAHLLCSWGEFAPVIGASGAISGLMAAGIRMLPPGDDRAADQPLLALSSSRVLLFSIVWAMINIAVGLTGFDGVGTEPRLIAWQAHLGGYACGLLLSGWFERPTQPV